MSLKKISILALSLLFACVACGSKAPAPSGSPTSVASAADETPTAANPRTLIVGTWWTMVGSSRVTLKFGADGSLVAAAGGQSTSYTYRWLDDGTIVINDTTIENVVVAPDKLTITRGAEVSTYFPEAAPASPQANPTPPT